MILAVQASMTWPDACTTVGVVASLTAGAVLYAWLTRR